jgi:hypothetical protein
MERRILQAVVALGGLVPVAAGAAGVFLGSHAFGIAADLSGDGHFRYLSGLLAAIGVGFWSTIPRIESRSSRFLLLALIVVTGGCGRLLTFAAGGVPDGISLFALTMELGVTPALCLWQRRVAAYSRTPAGDPEREGARIEPEMRKTPFRGSEIRRETL